MIDLNQRRTMAHHVLVPFTDSEEAKKALEHALTSFPDAKLTVIHVNDANRPSEEGRRQLEHAEEIADEAGVPVETELREGVPIDEIIRFTEETDVDHVVMGSRGRSGMSRLLLGSVAEAVVRRSEVPVTVVR